MIAADPSCKEYLASKTQPLVSVFEADQFIGEFEDPDSNAYDEMSGVVQLIGEPLDIDTELDTNEASVVSLVEDPDAEPALDIPDQIIGEPLSLDEDFVFDEEREQIIGDFEELPEPP